MQQRGEIVCKSYKNSSSSVSDISSDEENTYPPGYWIVDISNIVAAFQKACTCRKCDGNVELLEIESCRAGLGAKFSIWCINSQCSINESFYSKNKTNRVFDVNKKSVRTYWVFKILQYFAVSPIVKFKFVEHVKYLEEKAFEYVMKILKWQPQELVIWLWKKTIWIRQLEMSIFQQYLMGLGVCGDGPQIEQSLLL